MFVKFLAAAKYVAETAKGAVVVLASPNMKIPPSKLDPHMPPRPWTWGEWVRMFSWRYNWQYMPIFRFWVFSAITVYLVYKFILPIKPRHYLMHAHLKHSLHELERRKLYGRAQKFHDDLYFKQVDPFRHMAEN